MSDNSTAGVVNSTDDVLLISFRIANVIATPAIFTDPYVMPLLVSLRRAATREFNISVYSIPVESSYEIAGGLTLSMLFLTITLFNDPEIVRAVKILTPVVMSLSLSTLIIGSEIKEVIMAMAAILLQSVSIVRVMIDMRSPGKPLSSLASSGNIAVPAIMFISILILNLQSFTGSYAGIMVTISATAILFIPFLTPGRKRTVALNVYRSVSISVALLLTQWWPNKVAISILTMIYSISPLLHLVETLTIMIDKGIKLIENQHSRDPTSS